MKQAKPQSKPRRKRRPSTPAQRAALDLNRTLMRLWNIELIPNERRQWDLAARDTSKRKHHSKG